MPSLVKAKNNGKLTSAETFLKKKNVGTNTFYDTRSATITNNQIEYYGENIVPVTILLEFYEYRRLDDTSGTSARKICRTEQSSRPLGYSETSSDLGTCRDNLVQLKQWPQLCAKRDETGDAAVTGKFDGLQVVAATLVKLLLDVTVPQDQRRVDVRCCK